MAKLDLNSRSGLGPMRCLLALYHIRAKCALTCCEAARALKNSKCVTTYALTG